MHSHRKLLWFSPNSVSTANLWLQLTKEYSFVINVGVFVYINE